MAFVLTYTTLTETVESYLERDDPAVVAKIPLFIMIAERNIARDLKILGLKTTVQDNFIPGNQFLSKPVRWLNDSFFNIGVGSTFSKMTPVEKRSILYCRQFWPDPNITGIPKYYSTDYNYDVWVVVPTPDVSYPYEIIYYETPPLIDETTSTNFLTIHAPEILIFATLLEAMIYLKDDERIKVWQDKYDKSYRSLGEEDILRIQDSFSKRGG